MYALIPGIREGRLTHPRWDLFDRFFEEIGRPMFYNGEKEWIPSFDVSETDDNVIVKAELPGMEAKDINITLTDNILTVKGEKREEREEKEKNYHLKESRSGSFSRSIRLPANVTTQEVNATYKDGLLKLTLPKAETEKVKKIEINQ